jgi:hypothetical protein
MRNTKSILLDGSWNIFPYDIYRISYLLICFLKAINKHLLSLFFKEKNLGSFYLEEMCRKSSGLGNFQKVLLFIPLIHRSGGKEHQRKSTHNSFFNSYAQGTRTGLCHPFLFLCLPYSFDFPMWMKWKKALLIGTEREYSAQHRY